MKHDKILKFYQEMNLNDKQSMLNMILGVDCFYFLSSQKRKVGFDLRQDSESAWATINGTQLQINLELDDFELCSTDKGVKTPKDWSKVKLNSFKM